MKTAELIQELEKHILTLNLKSDRASIRLIRRSIKKLSEYTSQQPTLSKDKVMEVLKAHELEERISTGENSVYGLTCISQTAYKRLATAISNLTPAVSDNHNYLQSPGFEHLSNGVQESGTSTDHTILVVSEQPYMNEEEILKMYDIRDDEIAQAQYYLGVARKKIIDGGNQSSNMIAEYAIEIALNHFASEIEEWFQSIQSAKGEEKYGNMSEAQIRRSKARKHLGGWFFFECTNNKLLNEALDIAAGLPPPTPDEKGGEG